MECKAGFCSRIRSGREAVFAVCLVLAVILAFCRFSSPASAYADEPDLTELQKQVEQSAQDYGDAQAQVADLKQKMADNQAMIDDVGSKLGVQQEKNAAAMKTLYLLQRQGYGLVDIVLGSQSIGDFLQNVEYIQRIQNQSADEMQKYAQMKSQYESARNDLADEEAASEEQAERARQALDQAQASRKQAQDRAIAEAHAQAARANAGTIDDGVDWSVDRDTFVAAWTLRIDAYLAGSPLAGSGRSFAEAAWDYGIDPRWSPAISNTESSKGLHVPYGDSYNAWGWTDGGSGFRTFGSWDEGIRAHVAYLARVYGYTITVGSAQKYCPPNYAAWYANTLDQMRMI
jgi:cell division protein FtsL